MLLSIRIRSRIIETSRTSHECLTLKCTPFLLTTIPQVRIARKIVMTSTLRRYCLVAAVSIFVGSVTYVTAYTRKSDQEVVNDLFSGSDNPEGMSEWASPSVGLSLCVYFLIKLVTTVLSISLPIPCGLFMPLVVLGAVAGRLFGELVQVSEAPCVDSFFSLLIGFVPSTRSSCRHRRLAFLQWLELPR